MQTCTNCHWHRAYRAGLCVACCVACEANTFYALRERLYRRWGDMGRAARGASTLTYRRMKRAGILS